MTINMIETFLYALGTVIIIKWTIQLLLWCWKMFTCFVLPSFGFVVDLKSFGSWAVITGATDGIGKEYALELARKGLNIVLISRTMSKLEAVAKEIEEKYSVMVKVIQFDFSVKDADYSTITEELNDLDVGILVNNVGVGIKLRFFSNIDISKPLDMVNVNIVAEVALTHAVLKGMVQRKKGVIVHISSGTSYFPIPLFQIYPATKAFVSHFTQGLQLELGAYPDIHHQLVTPHFVQTNMAREAPAFVVLAPVKDFVRYAVGTIGIADKTTGFWKHEIEAVVWKAIPAGVMNFLFKKMVEKLMKQKREKKVE